MNPPLPHNEEEKTKNTLSSAKSYVKYSGLAFQMLAIILAGVLIGKQLDTHFSTQQPIFTGVLALLATALALYIALKDFIKTSSKK